MGKRENRREREKERILRSQKEKVMREEKKIKGDKCCGIKKRQEEREIVKNEERGINWKKKKMIEKVEIHFSSKSYLFVRPRTSIYQ